MTEGSLWAGIAALASARRLGEVGDADRRPHIESSGEGYGILRDYVGHGIGRKMHEAPTVFNYRVADPGPEVRPGLVPRDRADGGRRRSEDDVRRRRRLDRLDGRRHDGSHWEHSVAVHEDGIWVLTAPDGGAAGLAPFGVTRRRSRSRALDAAAPAAVRARGFPGRVREAQAPG